MGSLLNTVAETDLSYSVVGFAETSTGDAAGIYGLGTATGIGGTAYAGYFNGNVHVTGTFSQGSDIKFKDNISEIEGSLNLIKRLHAKEFTYKKTEGFSFPEGKHFGLIAQEVQQVIPELVEVKRHLLPSIGEAPVSREEYLSVDYIGLIPHLIKSIQELNLFIEEQGRIIESLLQLRPQNSDQMEASLQVPYFSQLFPNPAESNVTVEIQNFPTTASVQVILRNEPGQIKHIEEVNQRIHEISTESIENGLFFVILIVDGAVFDIDRIIVNK